MQVTFKGLKWLNIIYICTHIHIDVCVFIIRTIIKFMNE